MIKLEQQTPALSSFFYRVDPRVKLFYFLLIILITFIVQKFWLLSLLFLLQVFLVIEHRIFRRWLKFMRSSVFIIGFILFLNLIFVPFISPTVNEIRVEFALIMVLRFIIIFTDFFVFSLSVPPDTLSRALTGLGIPYSFSWKIATAYRFIPLFTQESQRIVEAQLARGIPLDGSLKERLRLLPTIIIPLFTSTLIKADKLAEALIARAWNPRGKRTAMIPLKITLKDCFCIMLILFLGVEILLFEYDIYFHSLILSIISTFK
ncbi:MAG: energy-coupling factor transporter transmembrane component T family protein [Promethearchaeota archaeon]